MDKVLAEEGTEVTSDTFTDYSILDPLIEAANELHPIEIYQNMLEERPVQAFSLYSKAFEYKKLRKKLCDQLFELGDTFAMDNLTIHIAIKYLEVVLHFINFYQRNTRTQRLPSDPKPVKETVPRSSVYFGKDTSSRVKVLSTVKKELLLMSCLLIAAKFNERDENLVKINELQKECKYNYTFKNITSCEAKILQELKWNLSLQTPLHYVMLFYSSGVIFSSDSCYDESTASTVQFSDPNEEYLTIRKECLRTVRHHCDYFVNLVIHDYYMLQFDEQIVAMACVICARKVSKIEPEYSENFQKLYGISMEDIQPAFERLWRFYQN